MKNVRSTPLGKKILALIIFITILPLPCFAQWQNTGYDPYTNIWKPGRSGYFKENIAPDNNLRAGWQMKNTQANLALHIFFLDSLYGWACHNGAPVGIVKTIDGGETWNSVVIFTGTGQLHCIHFIDKNTGWTGGTRFYKTINGGLNWTARNSGYERDFTMHTIHFTDSNTGFIGGLIYGQTNKALLSKTTDSGETWDSVFVSTKPHSNIRSQFWFDSDTGWFGGGNCLLKTTDGGITFIDYTQYLPFASNGSHGISDIKFVNELTGWIGGSNVDQKNIHKTTDGGFTWIFQDNPVAPYFFMQINAIEFLDENTGWGASIVGMIIKTTNGGSNWFVDLTHSTEFWSFSYIPNKRLWCGAEFGQAWNLDYDKIVGITQGNEIIPGEYKLHQNYPNPFNPVTVISYELPVTGAVKLSVYDILGKEVAMLVNKRQNAGRYNYQFSIDDYHLSSGVYFYTLKVNESYIETKKMVVLR